MPTLSRTLPTKVRPSAGGRGRTVKPPARVPVCPPGFVTVTSRGPAAAVAPISMATASSRAETTVVDVTVTPAPKAALAPGSKLSPVTVTLRLVPTVARSGETLAMTGAPGLTSALSARSTWIRGRVVPVPARVSVIRIPVSLRAWRTSSTLAVGAACLRIAQAPVTCGAAIDVPLAIAKSPPGNDEMMSAPGANRDRKGATFEKSATWSSLVVAPTLTAVDTHAGALSWPVAPSLPAATTVAMPAARRLSMNGL